MISTLSCIKNKSLTFLRGQLGAVAFEYVLIIGGVSVVIFFAMSVAVPSLANALMDATCKSIKETVFEPLRHPEEGVHNHGFNLKCPKG